MHRGKEASLFRKKDGSTRTRIAMRGRLEDLVRQYLATPPRMRHQYSVLIEGVAYGPNEIEKFARDFGIVDDTSRFEFKLSGPQNPRVKLVADTQLQERRISHRRRAQCPSD